MEQWLNDKQGKTEILEEKPVPLPVFHHKSKKDWSGIEPEPPQ
jgi:hypothetical protein